MSDISTIIRSAEIGDIPQMAELLEDLFSIESGFSADFEKQVCGLTMLLNDPSGSSLIVVAVREDAIIGMGTVQLVVSTAEGGATGLVEDIIVQKDYRGTGIGTRILSQIHQWCKMRGATRLQLLADIDNTPACHFYSLRGWVVTNLVCLRKYL